MRTLEENEAIIEAGLKSFVEMGEALKEIRNNKQYEKRYGTGVGWDSYLRQRWGMSKQRASELILSSEAVAGLKRSGMPDVLPINERQVNELRKASEAQQPAVWVAAVKEAESKGREQPTAKEVSNIVSMTPLIGVINQAAEEAKKQIEKQAKKVERQEKAVQKNIEQQAALTVDDFTGEMLSMFWLLAQGKYVKFNSSILLEATIDRFVANLPKKQVTK